MVTACCVRGVACSLSFRHSIAFLVGNLLPGHVAAGIVVRFMNGTVEGNGIRDALSANNLIQQVCFHLRVCV